MNSLAHTVHRLVVARQSATPPLSPLEHAVLTDLESLLQRPHTELDQLLTADETPEWAVLPGMLGVGTSPA